MLRKYQEKAVEESWSRACKGERPIIVSPTGSGKTYIAAALVAQARADHMRILVLTPRREILTQTIEKVELFGIQASEIGVIMGADTHGLYRPVQIASWSTLVRRSARSDACLPIADLVIIDECHLALSKKLKARVLDYYAAKSALIIGMTATPARRSGYGLGDFFTSLVRTLSVQQLIDLDYLVPGSYWGGSLPDMVNVATSKGDWVMTQASRRCRRPTLVGDVVANWLRLAGGRHTIAFCCDIAHAHALAERFVREGVATCVITDKTPTDERDDLMADFRSRETQVLCNVGIASYGFDVPSVDCIVLARPTKSLVLHLQQIGRGLRGDAGKDDCLVLDHAGNVPQHGMAEDGQFWMLDIGKRVQDRTIEKRKRKPIECSACHHIFNGSRECPKCHWEKPAPKRDVNQIDADLVPITRVRTLAQDDQQGFYFELRALAEEFQYKRGWAWHKFQEKFKQTPANSWDDLYAELAPLSASPRTRRWVRSRQIAWAKRKRPRTASVVGAQQR